MGFRPPESGVRDEGPASVLAWTSAPPSGGNVAGPFAALAAMRDRLPAGSSPVLGGVPDGGPKEGFPNE